MTAFEGVLLYFRLVLYPACSVGFIWLMLFESFPNERRRTRQINRWFYFSLALVFASLSVTSLMRLTLSAAQVLRLADYSITLPMLILFVALTLKVWWVSRAPPPPIITSKALNSS